MKPIPILPEPIDFSDRIAFYGPMCAGKTYCADYLSSKYSYKKFSLATRLKELVHQMYGQVSKDGEGRKLYQGVGSALRQFDPDCWTKAMLDDIWNFLTLNRGARLVVDDVRYENEARLLEQAGFILVEVYAEPELREQRFKELYPSVNYEEASSHASEREFGKMNGLFRVYSGTDKTLVGLDRVVSTVIRPV